MSNIKKYIPTIFFVLSFLFFLSLGFLRDSLVDENIYLGESALIAALLKSGQWIGDYGVGLHGFLSKFLVGIIYIFTGPSVFVPTLLNIVFGVLCGVVFYNILRKNFKFSMLRSLLGVIILFSNYQFITYVPTFYRDIGALLFVLLFLESILSKRSKWISGLYLLLVFDAKEHVFFSLAPAIVIWLIIEAYREYKGSFWKIIKGIFFSGVKMFLPSLVFFILMFTTSLIPLNAYNASILGLVEGGLKVASKGFNIDEATYNQDLQFNKEDAVSIPLIPIPEGEDSVVLISIITSLNYIISYIGKVFYPRTFSFLSIPFIILIPALYLALKDILKYYKSKEYNFLLLPIILIVYLTVYILRASLGRYLLPIAPIIIVYFLYFLNDFAHIRDFKKIITLICLFTVCGMFFEYSYILVKLLFSVFLICFLWFMYKQKKYKIVILNSVFVVILGIFTVGTSLLASYRNGQIGAFLLYGYNRECEKIVEMLPENKKVWINDIGWDRLPSVLMSEDVQDPEWKWSLKEWIPKKKLLKRLNNQNIYNFSSRKINSFKENIILNGIEKVVYIDLKKTYARELLGSKNKEEVLNLDILVLEEKIEMKNKDVYILNVVK
jgi:hypothetical protein